MTNEPLDEVEDGRRRFVKRMVAGTAFAVPVVQSFSMSSLSYGLEAQASNLSP